MARVVAAIPAMISPQTIAAQRVRGDRSATAPVRDGRPW